jgi:hypothetical protein
MSDQPNHDQNYMDSIVADYHSEPVSDQDIPSNVVVAFRGAPKPHQRPFTKFSDFLAAFEPIAYALDGIMRSGSLYTLTARTGTGKTAFNVILALAVVTGEGKRLLGRDVEQGRVLYVALENPDDVRMRFLAACYLLNIDSSLLDGRLEILPHGRKAEDICADMACEREQYRIVIVDTFAAHFDGKDVNNNSEVIAFVRRYRPMTQLPGRPTVLVSAHPVKGASDDNLIPYGAGGILNEVDGNLTLARKAGGVFLHHKGKIRGADFEPVAFRFEGITTPDIVDVKGFRIETPVLMPLDAVALEARQEAYDNGNLALLKAIADNPGASIRTLQEAAGIKSTKMLYAGRERLKTEKLVEEVLGKLAVTKKGEIALKSADAS